MVHNIYIGIAGCIRGQVWERPLEVFIVSWNYNLLKFMINALTNNNHNPNKNVNSLKDALSSLYMKNY